MSSQLSQQQILQDVHDDASDALNVKIVSGGGGGGGDATAANQVIGNASLASIDGKIVVADTGNVTVVGSALPTGAATEAKQDSAILSLGDISTAAQSLDGKTTVVNTQDVAITSTVLAAGAATEAKQDTGNTSLSSIDGKIVAVDTGNVSVASSVLPTGAATEATLASIDGNVIKADTDNVTVISAPLPADAATETTLSALNAKVTVVDTSDVSVTNTVTVSATDLDIRSLVAASDNVAISDGTDTLAINADGSINVTGTVAVSSSGLATDSNQTSGAQKTQITNSAGTAVTTKTLGTQVASGDLGIVTNSVIHGLSTGGGGVYVDVKVTPSGALVADVTATDLDIRNLTSGTDSVSAVQSGTWSIADITGTVSLPTGAATETTLASIDGNVIKADTDNVTIVSSSLPTGAATEATLASIDGNIIKADTDNVSVTNTVTVSATDLDIRDLSSVSDSVAAVQSGTWSARIQDSSGNSLSSTANSLNVNVTGGSLAASNLDVVDFIDTTPVLDTSSTNIPASSTNPVEVVASLAANVKKIKINDTTGESIGIYTGAPTSEVLQAISGPGEDGTIEVLMSSGERVSLRNMANSTISTGTICIQFIG